MAVGVALKVLLCAHSKDYSLVPLTRLVKVSKSPGLSLVDDLVASVLFSSSFGVGVEGNGTSCGGGGIASGEEEAAA